MSRKPWHSATELPTEKQRIAQVRRAEAAIEAADPTDFAGVGVRSIVRTFALKFGVVADEGGLYAAAEKLAARAA